MMERDVETEMEKERLAAFVDGELSPEEAADVVLHLARHPGDQAYVDELFAANAALAETFSDPMKEPVPEAILAAIMGGPERAEPEKVIPFRPRKLGMGWVAAGAALAATVAVATFLLPQAADRGLTPGLLAASDDLANLLETQVAGAPVTLDDGREAMVLATFALPEEGFCREFEVIDQAAGRIDYAVACREAAGWDIRVAMVEGTEDGGPTEGFATASGVEAEALMTVLESGDAEPLGADAEAAALATGWTQP